MSQELPEKIPSKFRKIGKSFRFSGYSLDPYKLEVSYDIRLTNEKFLKQQVAERISEFVKTKIKDRGYHGSRIESYGNRVSFMSRPKSRKNEDGLSYYNVEFLPGYFLDSGSLKVVYRRVSSPWKISDFLDFLRVVENSLKKIDLNREVNRKIIVKNKK